MKESLQIDIREGDKKWIFIPPSLSKKKHISTLQFANFLIINFNTVAPRVIYTHSNESTRNLLCLFLSFFSLSLFYALHEFSIEYQSVGKTIISVHRSRRQKPCAFWNGIPSPSPFDAVQFSLPLPSSPQKNYPFISATRKQVISSNNGSSSSRVVVSFDPGNEKINNRMEPPLEWIKYTVTFLTPSSSSSSSSKRSLFPRKGEERRANFNAGGHLPDKCVVIGSLYRFFFQHPLPL